MKQAEQENLRKMQLATAVKQDKARQAQRKAEDEEQHFERLKATYSRQKLNKEKQAELNAQMLKDLEVQEAELLNELLETEADVKKQEDDLDDFKSNRNPD